MKQAAKPTIRKMRVSTLKGWDGNPREISEEALAGLARSMDEFGLVQPIIWNRKTKRVVGGHQRLQVLKQQGVAETDVVVVNLTPEREAALNVALNNPEIAGVFTDEIGDLLKEIEADDKDLFEGLRLDALADGFDFGDSVEVVEDDAPELPKEPKTKAGDLWLLGEHRLLCGDSTKREDVERVMGGERACAVVTDPPYGTGIDSANGLGNSKMPMSLHGDKDTQVAEMAYLTWADVSDVHIWWGANYYSNTLPQSSCWAVWDKDHHGMTFADAELAWVNRPGPVRVFRHAWSGNHKASESGEARFHPTQKPVALFVWLLDGWCKSSILIADPFLGSGTTLIAAEQLNRKCYGLEISPAYCDVIVERWENFTGKKATLDTRLAT